MSHCISSTNLFSSTTDVPLLPYIFHTLYQKMTISPYSSWVCIYKLHHGHWMCSLFPGIITSTGAIFIGQSKKIHLKKKPQKLIFGILIQYLRALLSIVRILDINNISIHLFLCSVLQHIWHNVAIATPIPLPTVDSIKKESLRFPCRVLLI